MPLHRLTGALAPVDEGTARDGTVLIVGYASNVSIGDASQLFDMASHGALKFSVERYDPAGNRLLPVAVVLARFRDGVLDDGHLVEVSGTYKNGILRARSVVNRTLDIDVTGGIPLAFKVGVGLVMAALIAVLLVVVL